MVMPTAITQIQRVFQNGKLTNTITGEVMSFEILLRSPEFERIVLPFTKNLEKLGVQAKVNTVDIEMPELTD